MAIQDLIRHITAQMGPIWNIWYLDDGLLVGSPEQISQALCYLEQELLKRGLRLNRAKSNLWGPAAPLVTGSDGMKIIPWQADSGVIILGGGCGPCHGLGRQTDGKAVSNIRIFEYSFVGKLFEYHLPNIRIFGPIKNASYSRCTNNAMSQKAG